MDNVIFGWKLFRDTEIPLAHHTGIILTWIPSNPWKSIVAHYGSDCTSRVLVETMKDAVVRSEVELVRINPHYRAKFRDKPYTLDKDGIITPCQEFLEFEQAHPQYDVLTSNCQHFVQRFVGDIPIEIDMLSHLGSFMQNIMYTATLGSKDDIERCIGDVADRYQSHRTKGICAWDSTLDLDVPVFD